ncbi:MAG: hypothetical protein CNLJKLNK_00737 [Holosporales bacterium]
MSIHPKLLEMLVCPLSKTRLVYDRENQELVSSVSGLAYKIVNGIPVMLMNHARIINPDQVKLFAPQLV